MRKLLWLAIVLIAVPATAQQPVYTPDQATLAVTLGSADAAATVRLEGRAGASVVITTANLSATVVPEVSADCTNWATARFLSPAGVSSSSIVFTAGAVTETHTIIAEGGMCGARARVSAYASGTSAAQIRATYVSGAHFATQPISGTVTVTDGAGALNVIVDSGTLTAVTTITNSVTVTDGSGALNVIVDSSALPSGAATSALQDGIIKDGAGDTTQANVSTGRLHVDGSGVTQPVSGTVTVSATNLDVQIGGSDTVTVAGNKTTNNAAPVATNVGVLPAVAEAAAPSFTEGNMVALSTNLAGALRVTGGGGGTEYVTNAVAPADPTGTTLVSERDDQLATLAEVEGDWTNTRATSKGALWVAIPDTNGDPITSFGGGTQYAEDTALAAGEQLTMAGVIRDATPASLVDADGDRTELQVDGTGLLWVNASDGSGAMNVIVDSSALPSGASTSALQDGIVKDGAGDTTQANVTTGRLSVDGSGVTQPVSGSVTVTQATATNLNAAVVGTGTAGTPAGNILTVQGVGSMTKLLVTPDSVALPANQSVNVAQVAGTNTVTGGVAGIIAVGGNVANAVAATANPVPVGGIFTTTPATLTSGQTATMQFTAAQNQKNDISTILGTAPTAAGKLDVKAADGDVFVRQTTATNLNAAVVGTGTAGTPAGNILTVQGVTSMTKLLVTPDSVALPANQSVNQAQRGAVAVVAGACERETLLYIQISQITGTQLITGTASERIYICGIQLMTATAQNVALVDGTVTVCGTGTTGLLGGATAATGWNFAANGGIVLPATRDSWAKTTTDADNVCLLQSSTGQISGSLTYISIPNI